MEKRIISRAKNIAAFLDRSERSAFHLLEAGKIRGARKVGGVWTLDTAVFFESFRTDADATAS
jgi:hypothetical protein